ncbi:hypothetical protein PS662_01383 [Pseudomonas fluorescens]|uniref:Uncharacterized protein n=1 Tax=Pseudomonas fluorescens TaxID=294 RepID=A0A5E6RBI3_PSEFL|nr:hypothetical protein PS662_01383 [Pseudomonas fluorescens]
MVGELVAHREPEAIGFAVVANNVEPAELGLFTGVFGKRWQRKRLAGTDDDAAITFIEPFRLHTGLPCRRFAALHAPFEDAHGVGHRCFIAGLLVHLVPRRSAAQMGQAGAADQHVRRVRVIQRRQDAQCGEQFCVVVADAQAEGIHLLLKIDPGFNRPQRQIAHRASVLYFADQIVLDHANTALAVNQFELHQTHDFSPVKNLEVGYAHCGSELARDSGITSNINVD